MAMLERELADSERTHQLRSACHVQCQHCAASAAVVAVAVFGSMHDCNGPAADVTLIVT